MPALKGENPCAGKAQSFLAFCSECREETKHYSKSGNCRKCSQQKAYSIQPCEKHGLSTFFGDGCRSCQIDSTLNVKWCDKGHGETTFQGETCCKCSTADRFHKKWCESCSHITTHQLGTCMECNRGGFVKGEYKSDGTCVLSSFEGCEGEFSRNSGAQRVCKSIHYELCFDCGTKFSFDRWKSLDDLRPENALCPPCSKSKSTANRSSSAKDRTFLTLKECVLCSDNFTPKNSRQVLCEKQHIYPCSGTSCFRRVLIQTGVGRSGKNGNLKTGSLISKAKKGSLICRSCSRRSSEPEKAFTDYLGLVGGRIKGIGQIDGLDQKLKIAFEYDGSYWHSLSGASERDRSKTQKLLDQGYFVVRVRENNLPHLPLIHPRLHQFSFNYSSPFDKTSTIKLAEIIKKVLP